MKELKILSSDFKVREIRKLELISEGLPEHSLDLKEISGSSPPEIFVGRSGYPKVYVGPLIPPFHGDSRHLAMPETWFGKGLDEIIGMRIQLVRGKVKVDVERAQSRLVEEMREAMLSENSVQTEAKLKNKPRGYLLSEDSQPFGPSAFLEELRMEPGRADPRIERLYYDRDASASEAIEELYSSGLPVSRIQQSLSAGLLGRRRKFVPTRWAITAVDDQVSRHLIDRIRDLQEMGEYRLYLGEYLNNRWAIIMMPGPWSYESIEAWFPGIITDSLAIAGDFEPFRGRHEYASMGGCYYAGRLAVSEELMRIGRQASVLILREAYPGYIPIGVWNVRESVRNILRGRPEVLSSLDECLKMVRSWLSLPIKVWMNNSRLLRMKAHQMSLEDFF